MGNTRIKLTVNQNEEIFVNLEENQASRDFLEMLPLTFEDFNSTEKIASAINGDLFEIEPVQKYTAEDLDWTNKQSRLSIEMQDKFFRPQILKQVSNITDYGTIVLGFPVWWYTAPTIINTFIEENNL